MPNNTAWTDATKSSTSFFQGEQWGRHKYGGVNSRRLKYGGAGGVRYKYGGLYVLGTPVYTQSSVNQSSYTGGTVKQTAWS